MSTSRVDDLLAQSPPAATLEWAWRAVDSRARLVSVTFLAGGISHANHVLRLTVGQQNLEVVLRRWVRTEWQVLDPEFSPEHEIATYQLLATSEVPAPQLLAAAPGGVEGDVPAILLTRSPGHRLTMVDDFSDFLTELARVLPKIHAIDFRGRHDLIPIYRPYYERNQLSIPSWATQPKLWTRAIEIGCTNPPTEGEVFIHRDYHPGNTLWQGQENPSLSAVVDWTTASRGHPGVDLAHLRANLILAYDLEKADQFLEIYEQQFVPGYRHHPYWDLRDVIDFLPDLEPTPAQVLRLESWVARILAELGQ